MSKHPLTPFTELAVRFRGSVINIWVLSATGTAAEKAAFLTEHARRRGLISRDTPVPGSALNEWGKRKLSPMWAALAAFDLLIKNGWKPDTDAEWAGFAALLIKLRPDDDWGAICSSLPEGIPRDVAAGWLVAAIEEDHHYRTCKRL